MKRRRNVFFQAEKFPAENANAGEGNLGCRKRYITGRIKLQKPANLRKYPLVDKLKPAPGSVKKAQLDFLGIYL